MTGLALPPPPNTSQNRDLIARMLMQQANSGTPKSAAELLGKLAQMGVATYRQDRAEAGKDPSLINALLGRSDTPQVGDAQNTAAVARAGQPGMPVGDANAAANGRGPTVGAPGSVPTTSSNRGVTPELKARANQLMQQGVAMMENARRTRNMQAYRMGYAQYQEGQKLLTTPVTTRANAMAVHDLKMKQRRAGRTVVNNQISVAQGKTINAFAKKVGELEAKRLDTTISTADQAEGLSNQLKAAQALLSKFETGAFANTRLTIGQVAKDLGVNPKLFGLDPNATASGEALRSITAQLALKQSQFLKGPASDRDIVFVQQTIPSLANTPEGNRKIIAIWSIVAKRQREKARQMIEFGRKHKTLTPQGGESFDQQWDRWQEKHPIEKDLAKKGIGVNAAGSPPPPKGFKVRE